MNPNLLGLIKDVNQSEDGNSLIVTVQTVFINGEPETKDVELVIIPDENVPSVGDGIVAQVTFDDDGNVETTISYTITPPDKVYPGTNEEPSPEPVTNEAGRELGEEGTASFDIQGEVAFNNFKTSANYTAEPFGCFDVEISTDSASGVTIPDLEKETSATICYFPLPNYPDVGTRLTFHVILGASAPNNDKQVLVRGTINNVGNDLINLGLQRVLVDVDSINGHDIKNERYTMAMLLPASVELKEGDDINYTFEVVEETASTEDPAPEGTVEGRIIYLNEIPGSGYGNVVFRITTIAGTRVNDQCSFIFGPDAYKNSQQEDEITIELTEFSPCSEDQAGSVKGTVSDIFPIKGTNFCKVILQVNHIDGNEFELSTHCLIVPNSQDFKEGECISFLPFLKIDEIEEIFPDETTLEEEDPTEEKPKRGCLYGLIYFLSFRWL